MYRKAILYPVNVQSLIGNTAVQLGGNPYWNVSNVLGAGEFTSLTGLYGVFRLTKISIEVAKLTSDSSTAVYADTIVPSFNIGFCGSRRSTNLNTGGQDDSLYVVPHTTIPQRRTWDIPSVYGNGTSSDGDRVLMNMRNWNPTNIVDCPGELYIQGNAQSNALSTTVLFTIRVIIEAEFAEPIV